MEALRAVVRIVILWVMSLAIAVAGLEAGHRIVAAIDRQSSVDPPGEVVTATRTIDSDLSR